MVKISLEVELIINHKDKLIGILGYINLIKIIFKVGFKNILFILLLFFIFIQPVFSLTGFEYLNQSTAHYYEADNNINAFDLLNTRNGTPSNLVNNSVEVALNYSWGFKNTSSVGFSNLFPQSANLNFSISFWGKKNSSNDMFIIDSQPVSTTRWWIETNRVSAGDICYVEFTPTAVYCTPGSVWPINTMKHIVVTKNGTTVYFYVNGVAQNASFSIGSSFNTATIFQGTASFIGKEYSGAISNFYNGIIDEISIFNRNITLTEVQYLYNSGNISTNQRYPFTDNIVSSSDYNFINQTPSDITTTNLFVNSNLTIFYNITKPNATNIYLNYTTNTTIGWIEKVNGSVVVSGYRQTNYSSKVGNITEFSLFPDNGVYPSVNIGYNQSIYSTQIHNSTLIISPNDYFKTEIYNISTISQNNYLELMLNSTVGTCRVFYCNSTYTTGNPATSGNCFHFATLINTPTFNHSHGSLSRHNLFNFPINASGFISTVKVTSDGFFLINAQTGTCQMQSIPNTTRTTTTQYSTNSGSAYSNVALTMDAHLHQFNSSDYFSYQVVMTNITNTTFSTFINDNLDITPFSPIIELDNPDQIDLNISSRTYNITWHYFLFGATNINFSVYLLNSSNSIIKNLSINQGNASFYNWDIVSSQIPVGTYKILIIGNDTNGLNGFDTGENFNLLKNAYFNVSARNNLTGVLSSSFTGWFYDYNTSINETFISNSSTIATLNIIQNNSYLIHIEPSGLSFGNINLTNSNYTGNHTFNLLTFNSININVFNEQTRVRINASPLNTTIFFQFISDFISTNSTSLNGTLYIDLLSPSEYEIRTDLTGFSSRSYFLLLSNGTYNPINIYLLNSSITEYAQKVIYVKDQYDNLQIGDIVYLQRQYINPDNTSQYITVEMCKTDSDAKCDFFVQQNANVRYRFVVVQNNIVVYTSTSFNFIGVIDDIIDLRISSGIPITIFQDYIAISGNVTFNNITNTFTGSYLDTSNAIRFGCFTTIRIPFNNRTNETIDHECFSSSNEIYSYTITNIRNDSIYKMVINLCNSDICFPIASKEHSFFSNKLFSDNEQYLVSALVVIIMFFICVLMPIWLNVIMSFGTFALLLKILQFNVISVGITIGWAILFLVGIWIGRKRQ